MSGRFDKVSADDETTVYIRQEDKCGGFDVLYEIWSIDGIFGHSVIFCSDDVVGVGDEELKTMVKEYPSFQHWSSLGDFSGFTMNRPTTGFTFVNFFFDQKIYKMRPMCRISRAAVGCLLGQLVGDALGSLVEFQSPAQILHKYPKGVRELADGGTWDTIAGQPTDDSEMALLLARMLVERKTYDPDAALQAYRYWLDSGPFDCGRTISAGLRGRPNPDSQANGALMRISPLGIFGANYPLETVGNWAKGDAALTHPNPICQQANALFTMAIAHAIASGCEAKDLYQNIKQWAADLDVDQPLMDVIHEAAAAPPADYLQHQGWVLIAFHNALWQLVHAPSFEEGVVDTIMQGGDTDTNAAICGALLGAVHEVQKIPIRWVERVLTCRPKAGSPGVHRPRPECFWPVDAWELALKLVD